MHQYFCNARSFTLHVDFYKSHNGLHSACITSAGTKYVWLFTLELSINCHFDALVQEFRVNVYHPMEVHRKHATIVHTLTDMDHS